ncbi:TIM barrel protein [Oceanicola sp. D3]|uniref:mannonate dehydratase n=1 Tax=Oceanicola sp. D3 TaxID=2587163 RepID=UPI001123E892|nr:mannonate dehydratase [Oceanicola sp. D3]QDC10805.1 TIM barrel protein [Oceanicola sp. D3]
MYIGEQISFPTSERLRLSRQLGCERVVIDARPLDEVMGPDGRWDAEKIRAFTARVAAEGLRVEVMALDVGSLLLDSLYAPERAEALAEELRANIRAAGAAGIPCLKFNVQMVGITRTGMVTGRGGIKCSAFRLEDYSPEKDSRFSYRGVVLPDEDTADGKGTAGQKSAQEVPGVTEAQGWQALSYLVNALVPTAEEAGVKLAAHPHDPAYPVGGLNGVHHNLGSIEGMRRFLDLANGSPALGLNFCQGTIAEMSTEGTDYVIRAIREFGPGGHIFMVHFRNIRGGHLDFHECFPDEGDVDMAACVRAYRDAGYSGILCPDHVPLSELDPDRTRFFAFALGYTKGLLHAA